MTSDKLSDSLQTMPELKNHDCVAGSGFALCYPKPKTDEKRFFFGVDSAEHPDHSEDQKNIRKHFGKGPKATPAPEAKFEDFPKHRFYEVTKVVPRIMAERLWDNGYYPGPNCFGTALCLVLGQFGLSKYLCGRYVDTSEAEALLSLFFRPALMEECNGEFGSVVVFDQSRGKSYNALVDGLISFIPKKFYFKVQEKPNILTKKHMALFDMKANDWFHHSNWDFNQESGKWERRKEYSFMGFSFIPSYSVGEHMAQSLPGESVFHKLTYRQNHGYRIDTLADAPKKVAKAAYDALPSFQRRGTRYEENNYSARCFVLKGSVVTDKGLLKLPSKEIDLSKKKRHYYTTLLNFYTELVRNLEREIFETGTGGATFEKIRPALMTVENLWYVLKQFRDEVKGNVKNVLHHDFALATAYYSALSLSYEIRVMSDKYAPITGKRPGQVEEKTRELFQNHYFHRDEKGRFRKDFMMEIRTHLSARKVPKKYWKAVTTELSRRLKEDYNPMKYVRYGRGEHGIFYKTLDAVLTELK